MAERRAEPAAIGLWVRHPSLTNSSQARGVLAQILTVVNRREEGAATGVHFMITVGLRVSVHVITSHGQLPRSLLD
jgi:hypothetical protein